MLDGFEALQNTRGIVKPIRRQSLVCVCSILLWGASADASWWWPFGAADNAQVEPAPTAPELYRWLDQRGVVRYTPSLDRIPDTRRNTAIRVVPGTSPRGEKLGASLPQSTGPGNEAAGAAQTVEPGGASTVPMLAGSDPFNAPVERRRVESERFASDEGSGTNTWPELDARIAELEVLIQADEEVIKDMLSAPKSGRQDDLIYSQELREIASRLPLLQGELTELRRWREQPRDR